MTTIFISYRRSDSQGLTGRIYDRLSAQFGADAVFMDVDTIPFGVDFREYLQNSVSRCEVLVAVVGQNWLAPSDGSPPRIYDPRDFVRIEIETALNRGIPVIPALIENASMPNECDLPDTLVDFAYRNAIQIDPGRDFHHHMNRLINSLTEYLSRNNASHPIIPNKQSYNRNPSSAVARRHDDELPRKIKDTIIDNLIKDTLLGD